jgi:tRNA 5-methylaminomethyl-2-thiouridine biosynthesis bifunctional protein
LRNAGFAIEKKQGFAGKRHMLVGYLNEPPDCRLKTRHTPWHIKNHQPLFNKSAIVVGAGLAGAFTAYALAKRGWSVKVIDERAKVADGASANQAAVLFPNLSAYRSPLTEFMLTSFLFASRLYRSFLQEAKLGELHGSLLLAFNQEEMLAQSSLIHWLTHYPELGVPVDQLNASILSGIALEQSGVFVPLSGWLNSPLLCDFLLNQYDITIQCGQRIEGIQHENGYWQVGSNKASVLILANGYQINDFEQTSHLPVKPIRGQMTAVAATKTSALLKIPICAQGHVLPCMGNVHYCGATYDLGISDTDATLIDDKKNIERLGQFGGEKQWSSTVIDHWAGVRATTPDYLPLVGPVPMESDFVKRFAGLRSNAKRWIAEEGAYYPHLYACAGFGSRGLTTIPLSAEYLASLLNQEISCLPRHLVQAISPARFLRKKIVRIGSGK